MMFTQGLHKVYMRFTTHISWTDKTSTSQDNNGIVLVNKYTDGAEERDDGINIR